MNIMNKKLSVVILGSLFTTLVFAQSMDKPLIANPIIAVQPPNPSVSNNEQSIQVVAGAALAGTNVQAPDSGNAYEKEVTPLLREISRKKAILNIKKLNAELEKMDSEMIKLKKEEVAPTPVSTGGKMINVQDLSNAPFVPNIPPQSQVMQNMPTDSTAQESMNSIKVLMTYGYENNLFAKVTNGSQGGYVVKRGDILPNGQQVVNITSNYIEVKKIKGKGKFEKIFVTGPEPLDTNGKPIVNSSAQKLPL
jgi:hypothetical protein